VGAISLLSLETKNISYCTDARCQQVCVHFFTWGYFWLFLLKKRKTSWNNMLL